MDEKKRPMFSIVMPCYNHGKYVGTAIESILNQTYQDFELIVADDGSTDNSWEVIQKYSDRIKSFRLEENDLPKCENMMLDMTTGRYLAHISSDDYWYPNKLELQAKAIEENPNCYAYFTWAAWGDENLVVTDAEIFSYYNRSRYEWLRTFFEEGTALSTNTMVTVNDKEKWLRYAQYVKNYRQLPDQMLLLKMFLNGDDVYVVPEVAAIERIHDNSIGTKTRETNVRGENETISIWNELWDTMPNDFFVKAFYNDLYDKNVTEEKEILCERMLVFLKLAEKYVKHQNTAINFFTKHYADEGIAETLLQKYEFTREDFFELTGKWGWGNLNYEIMARKYATAWSDIKVQKISTLHICNRQLINILDSDSLDDAAIHGFIQGVKEYLLATLNVMEDVQMSIGFHRRSCIEVLAHLDLSENLENIDWELVVNFMNAEAQRLKKLMEI